MSLSRRGILAAGLALSGYSLLAEAAEDRPGYRNEVYGYGPLRRDPEGVFDLPQGFSYTVVSRAGDAMSDGFVTPYKADGMGCFPLDADRVRLVRNHELQAGDIEFGPLGRSQRLAARLPAGAAYDRLTSGPTAPGGTTTLVYNLRQRRLERDHLSLLGTSTNCAGGVTPWGSWLTCEEIVASSAFDKSHGWVFEVPSAAAGLAPPIPLTSLGRFRHEAACVDPRTGIVYLTEDESDGEGLFYRFLPNDRTDLAKGGRLQALGFKDSPRGGDSRNWRGREWAPSEARDVAWIDLDAVHNPDADLHQRGHAAGAAWFARGEGIFFTPDGVYFTCTSGGPGKLGQIMRYRPSAEEGRGGESEHPGRLELFVQSTDARVMRMCDNIAVAPWGHLFACEDKPNGTNYLKAVTPAGKIYTVGRNPVAPNFHSTELAGVCFSPDGTTLFVNVYWPGITLAVTGPWASLRA